jgi:hypothetical protein
LAVNKKTLVSIAWPLPVGTKPIRYVVSDLLDLIKKQYPGREMKVESVFVGNRDLDGLSFDVDGAEVRLIHLNNPRSLAPGYMDISFTISPTPTN